jgi:hypothetical protein
MSDPLTIVSAVRLEIDTAVDAILTAATAGLQELPEISETNSASAERLQRHLLLILESCAVQDLAGQRLDQLCGMLEGTPSVACQPDPLQPDPLLNGPALQGQGLDQAQTDSLLLGS